MSKENAKHINEPCSFQIKAGSVVRSSMHPYLENWVAIGPAAVHYDQAARALNAGIKWRHCTMKREGKATIHIKNSFTCTTHVRAYA